MPQVQDDVFYAQPLPDSSKVKDKNVAITGSSTLDQPSIDPVVRDVRFSSPLEGPRQTNTPGSQPNKSSLKKGATSRPAPVQVHIEALGIQQQGGQILTIVVNPVSQYKLHCGRYVDLTDTPYNSLRQGCQFPPRIMRQMLPVVPQKKSLQPSPLLYQSHPSHPPKGVQMGRPSLRLCQQALVSFLHSP